MTAFPPPTGPRSDTFSPARNDPRYVNAYSALDRRSRRISTATGSETRAVHLFSFARAGGCPTCYALPSEDCFAWKLDGKPRSVDYRHEARLP